MRKGKVTFAYRIVYQVGIADLEIVLKTPGYAFADAIPMGRW